MLFDTLSVQDIQKINSYIQTYGPVPGSCTYQAAAPLDYRLRYWEAAKEEYLYKMLGSNLIVEKEIEYHNPIYKIRSAIDANAAYRRFKRAYTEKALPMIKLPAPETWLSSEYYVATQLITPWSLAQNRLENTDLPEPVVLDFSDGTKIKIESTTKPMRVLGKIAVIIDEKEAFEEFRLEHSRILNQKILKGTLCLSIHPLDYMTMSDNASGWTSCMSWKNTGGYRMGTVEMMNSNCVLVAYLKDAKSCEDWNNKHWRTLVIVRDEIITTVKAYPYQNDTLNTIVVDWIKQLCEKNLDWTYGPTSPLNAGRTKYEGLVYYLEPETNVMYNDFDSDPIISGALPLIDNPPEDPINLDFCYSGKTECMWCGRDLGGNPSYDEGYVFCEECCSNADDEEEADTYECCNCNEYWAWEDMYEVEGDYLCPDCVEDLAVEEVTTCSLYYRKSCVKVYLAEEDGLTDNYVWIHRSFLENHKLPTAIFDVYISHPRQTETGEYYLNADDLSHKRRFAWFGC